MRNTKKGMEIRIENSLDMGQEYIPFRYKGVNFLRTSGKTWASVKANGRWYSAGHGGYDYAILEDGKVKLFDSMKDVKLYINTHVKLMEAKKEMEELLRAATA